MTPQQLTAAPVSYQLGTRTYELRTLTEKDTVELDNFVQQMIIGLARQAGQSLMPLEKQEILQAGINSALGVEWNSDQGWKVWDTTIGGARLAWQSASKPGKFEDFFSDFSKKETLEDNKKKFYDIFWPLNYIKEQPNGDSKS